MLLLLKRFKDKIFLSKMLKIPMFKAPYSLVPAVHRNDQKPMKVNARRYFDISVKENVDLILLFSFFLNLIKLTFSFLQNIFSVLIF